MGKLCTKIKIEAVILFLFFGGSTLAAQTLTLATSSTPISCSGAFNGTASVSISGGTSPYTIIWIPAPASGQGTAIATGLGAGVESVRVTDAAGVTDSASITIADTPLFTLTTTCTPSGCGLSNGTATVSVSGAGGPFTYSWTPGGVTSTGSSNTQFTGLSAGTYTVTVTGAAGCVQTAITVVTNTGGPTVTLVSETNATCSGICNGSATISASGGTGTLTYSWYPYVGSTPTMTGLCQGYVTATVTDAAGCSGSLGVNIGMSTNMVMTTQQVNTTCSNNNGSASVMLTGGTAPYTYSWVPLPSGVNGQGTNQLTGLSPSCYTVFVTDSNNCGIDGAICLGSAPVPSLQLSKFDLDCHGSNSGSIAAHPGGGTPPYLFSWSTGANTDSITQLSSGSYSLTITDANGCTATDSVRLLPPGQLYLSLNSTSSNCTSNGTAFVVDIQGGFAPYTYSWNTTPPQLTAVAQGLAPGSYSLVVTDPHGCTASGSVRVYNSGCKGIIKGRVFNDANSNCIQDPGENGIPNINISTQDNSAFASTDANGDYMLLTDSLHTPLQLYLPANWGAPCQTLTPIIALANYGDTSLNNNFALSTPTGFDLAIHPGWLPASRPGFTKEYWIFYYNQGYQAQNGVVTFRYDSNLIFNSATQSPVVDSLNHIITWTLPNIPNSYCCQFGSSQQLHIFFTVPATLPLSYNLVNHFEIDPISGDYNPWNNTLDSEEPITGSHDPNLLTVMPAGATPDGGITPKDSVLFYTVNFQNTGSDTAFTVIVKDTLSPFLDPATFQPGASSNPYTFTLSDKGLLTWRFDGILLPDSTVNNAGSNGFLNYSVKLRKGLHPGTVITNRADVFFDFNAAILTNTTVNTLYGPNGIEKRTLPNTGIFAYPNPFDESTTILISGTPQQHELILYDVVGQEVKRFKSSESTITLQRESLAKGIYFLKVFTDQALTGEEKLVIR